MRLLLASLRLTSVSSRCLASPGTIHPAAVTTTCLPGLPLSPAVPSAHRWPCPTGHQSPRTAGLHTSHPAPGLRDLVAPGGAVRNLLGKLGVLNVSRARLRAAGYRLYESAADSPSYEEFFQLCDMPDTFFSW